MKKFFTQKAFLLFTLFFVFIAIFSFAAFWETEQACTEMKNNYHPQFLKSSDMLWEVVSRQFLSLLTI